MTSALLLLDGMSGVLPAATRKEPECLRSLSREFLGARRFLQVSLTPGLNSLSTNSLLWLAPVSESYRGWPKPSAAWRIVFLGPCRG